MRRLTNALLAAGVSCQLLLALPCRADQKAEMQKQLNGEVLNQGFDVKREDELNAYIDAATRKGLVPKAYTGTHWRRGATCDDLLGYAWSEYRDCMYYYHYYGRYYSYR